MLSADFDLMYYLMCVFSYSVYFTVSGSRHTLKCGLLDMSLHPRRPGK